jgi:hypothetical protein
MDTLSTRDNLLTTDKQIIRVGEKRVFWIRHGVEGASRERVLVHDVEVHSILLFHDGAETLLIGCADVLVSWSINTFSLSREEDGQVRDERGNGARTCNKAMPSAKVMRSGGLLYWSGSKGYC